MNTNTGEIAVITSCFNRRLARSAALLAEAGVHALDIYWPDMPDIHELAQGLNPVAKLHGDQWELTNAPRILNWLMEQLAEAEDKVRTRIKVVSFTTSFPGISEPVGSPARQTAIQSLVTLLRVAECLRLPCIQIRTGRRIYSYRGALRPVLQENDHYFDGDDEALNRLRQSLIDVANTYKEQFGSLPTSGIALELEPGQSFLLRSVEHLKRLSFKINDAIQRGYLTSDWVGLNLDIGHCLILKDGERKNGDNDEGRMLPHEFKDGEELILPIYGAHLSDHSLHHAADLAPGYFNPAESFDDYLWFYLEEVPKQYMGTERMKYYSGHVSIELEAVEYLHHVARAYRTINWRLFEIGDRKKVTLHPTLQPPREVEACIIFADLRKSTAATCQLQREGGLKALVDFTNQLNEIFVRRMRAIEPQARLDKFIGDAAMIVLEGPAKQTVEQAMRIACSIIGEEISLTPELNEVFQGIGIGIGYGKIASGYIGPTAFQEETVLGTEVIFASRLSGIAEKGQILTSPAFYEAHQKIASANRWREIESANSTLYLEINAEPYWQYTL